MKSISELIRKRRTYKPRYMKPHSKVPDAVVEEALTNALWAPTHGRTQPWFFKVFSGEALKRLAEQQAEAYKDASGEKFTEAKYNNLVGWTDTVSHAIAIIYRRPPLSRIPELEELLSMGSAVQNIALTIAAKGYAGMWHSGGVTYLPQAKEILGLMPGDKVCGFFLVGEIPDASEEIRGSRLPLHEKMEWFAE